MRRPLRCVPLYWANGGPELRKCAAREQREILLDALRGGGRQTKFFRSFRRLELGFAFLIGIPWVTEARIADNRRRCIRLCLPRLLLTFLPTCRTCDLLLEHRLIFCLAAASQFVVLLTLDEYLCALVDQSSSLRARLIPLVLEFLGTQVSLSLIGWSQGYEGPFAVFIL